MKILVIAAHPDDEVLGCGGTIAKAVQAGHEVQVLHLTTVTTARGDVDTRERAIKKAAGVLGCTTCLFSFSDQRFDQLPLLTLTKTLEQVLTHFKPDVVYTHHISDLNQDHQAVARASLIATRPLPGSTIKEVLMYPVLSSTEQSFGLLQPTFRPNVFTDIDTTFSAKLGAMRCYESELREYPHPRSIAAIGGEARHYGSMVGIKFAEAFELVRSVRVS
ncbi:MAG: PIG-L deacetylase family protein [Stenomitos frigidus ULC029]